MGYRSTAGDTEIYSSYYGEAYDTVNVSDLTITDDADFGAYGGEIDVTDVTVDGDVDVEIGEAGVGNFSGIDITGEFDLEVYEQSTAEFSDITIQDETDIEVYEDSTLGISGSTFEGEVDDIEVYDGAILNLSDNTYQDDVYVEVYDDGILNITGGDFQAELEVEAEDQAIVNVSGGDLGTEFYIYDDASFDIFGHSFLLDGMAVGFGPLDLGADQEGLLSGILADGTPFTDAYLFDESSGSFNLIFQINNVPEPSSVAIWSLLGLALAGFGYRRVRRKK